jgi:hypothetical protein
MVTGTLKKWAAPVKKANELSSAPGEGCWATRDEISNGQLASDMATFQKTLTTTEARDGWRSSSGPIHHKNSIEIATFSYQESLRGATTLRGAHPRKSSLFEGSKSWI